MLFNRVLNKNGWRIFIVLMLLFVITGCTSEAEPAPEESNEVVVVEETAVPTNTPEPTETPAPTSTPEPTETTAQTNTPEPTATQTPEPTNTPGRPTLTPTIDKNAILTATAEAAEMDEEENEDVSEPESSGEVDPADALEILLRSEEATAKAETIVFSQVVEVIITGQFTQTMTQNCQIEQEDVQNGYCETITSFIIPDVDPIEESGEVVLLGDQMWSRQGEDEEWEQMPEDFMESAGFSEDMGQVGLSEFITLATVTDETKMNDKAVYEISFELDVATYFGSILGDEAASMFTEMSEEMSGRGKMWIGKEDFYPVKADIQMMFLIEGEEMTTSTLAEYDYNVPVSIPDPTE